MGDDDLYDGKRFVPRSDWTYIEKADLAELQHKADEAERLLRLTGALACGDPTGDQSLAFLRQQHSSELADISIAIDLVIEGLKADNERMRKEIKAETHDELRNLQRRLDAVLDLHDSEWCEICQTALGCATRRAAEGEE